MAGSYSKVKRDSRHAAKHQIRRDLKVDDHYAAMEQVWTGKGGVTLGELFQFQSFHRGIVAIEVGYQTCDAIAQDSCNLDILFFALFANLFLQIFRWRCSYDSVTYIFGKTKSSCFVLILNHR